MQCGNNALFDSSPPPSRTEPSSPRGPEDSYSEEAGEKQRVGEVLVEQASDGGHAVCLEIAAVLTLP